MISDSSVQTLGRSGIKQAMSFSIAQIDAGSKSDEVGIPVETGSLPQSVACVARLHHAPVDSCATPFSIEDVGVLNV